jgi:hypothetical protein
LLLLLLLAVRPSCLGNGLKLCRQQFSLANQPRPKLDWIKRERSVHVSDNSLRDWSKLEKTSLHSFCYRDSEMFDMERRIQNCIPSRVEQMLKKGRESQRRYTTEIQ